MTDMKNVDHTHPHTSDSFGEAFRRGPDVAADGGERDAEPETDSERESSDRDTNERTTRATMEDVDHTTEEDGVDRTFERGTEGRSDSV